MVYIDARNLIRHILQVDPSKRLTIPQILAFPWFTSTRPVPPPDQVQLDVSNLHSSPSPVRDAFTGTLPIKSAVNTQVQTNPPSVSPATSTASESFLSASSHLCPSTPTTPEDTAKDPFDISRGNASQTTITKASRSSRHPSKDSITWQPETVIEEEPGDITLPLAADSTVNVDRTPRAPPYPTRTPARTKRRSVSSTLSDPGSPTLDKPLAPLPPQDFASLLNTPAPIIFSTPAERELLNSLSLLGFDTGQIVHSVLSDACDAAGAIWWMLKRKQEKRVLAGEIQIPSPAESSERADDKPTEKGKEQEVRTSSRKRIKRGIGVQTEDPTISQSLGHVLPAPEFTVLPPTPTVHSTTRPTTPPRAKSPFLSPSPTTVESSSKSGPSTPNGSVRDRDSKGRRDSKARSGSVSIMQRATNALEIAGLVRKKSNEAVKGDDREREREKSRDHEKRNTGGDEPRNSGNSGKLTKSPPVKTKEQVIVPATPSGASSSTTQPLPGSPWVVTGGRTSPPQSHSPTPATSEGDTLTSLPNFTAEGNVAPPNRHRASLLSAFRLWFHEDRKGKRKEAAQPQRSGRPSYSRSLAMPPSVSMSPGGHGNVKRRGSGTGRGRRVKRHSTSSRRSSSVNSRRSSGNSAQILVLESPHILEQIPSGRSYGAHTPSSDRGDLSSRPSSIRSFSLGHHRKSPSTGSNGSAHYRTGSPMHKYHRRAGSSSSIRVMRQIHSGPRPVHNRTNSATSSVHSLASSRPASFYEASESEGARTSSPYRSYTSRRSLDETPRRGTAASATFVAQKRLTPFMSPSGIVSRTSWKKSWGHEPPGWQSRSIHLPVEILSISPAPDGPASIRDVFTGRQSLSLGDESDWVDEDDDVPEFAGGLGQMPTSSTSTSSSYLPIESPIPMSPPVRNHNSRSGKNRATSLAPSNGSNRAKQGHSPSRTSPVPIENVFETAEMRGGRRQLPTSRSGPAFKHAIQEEDEGEEE